MSKFVWFEYVSKDIAKAQGFFGELFNWGVKRVPMPGGEYAMISVGEQLEAVSFGKERPAAQGNDEAALAKNRRAELKDK